MRRLAPAVAVLFLALTACQDTTEQPVGPSPDAEAALEAAGDGAPERIVLLDEDFAPGPPDANRGRASDIAGELGLDARHAYGTAVFGFVARVPDGRLGAIERDPRVVQVEDVETWEIDLVSAASQEIPTGIDRVEVDRNPTVTTDGSGVSVDTDVVILDTGIDPDHQDLNVAGGRNFSRGSVDNWSDGHGHGTHVSGTVAAKDNGLGVVGVAPGARLWAARVCNNAGFCNTGDIVAAIDWTAEQKSTGAIDFAAANFSISSADDLAECSDATNSVHQAICGLVEEGVVFVMSAGNDNREKEPFPVAFSVSAIADFDGKAGGAGEPTCRSDEDDTLANFSNFGEHVDIAAPGVCIFSTLPGGYGTMSGTSMSAPHVTGGVALYLHANGLSPAQDRQGAESIRSALMDSGHPQGTENHECSYDDSRLGGPLLFTNAAAFGGDGSCGVAGEPDEDDDEDPEDPEDPDDPEVENDPVIDQFDVATRTSGPWNRAEVTWAVSHEDDALESVTSELLDADGSVLDSASSSVSGSEASGEHELRSRSEATHVRLTVEDTAGNTTSETKAVSF